MRVYVLQRAGEQNDPKMRELTAPEEAPISEFADGLWTVKTKLTTTVDALARRHRFRVFDQYEEADLPPKLKQGEALATAGEAGNPFNTETNGVDGISVFDDFMAWRDRRILADNKDDGRDGAYDAADAIAMIRRPFGVGKESATVARHRAATEPLDDVSIVLVAHGWGMFEYGAAERMLDVISSLGPSARLSIVQNRKEDWSDANKWHLSHAKNSRVRFQNTENNGFAAACNLGVSDTDTSKILLTQPDAWFGADAVRLAVALSDALKADPSGGGRPAVIGPSGGYTASWGIPVFSEVGRNVERFGDPVPVDWVGGYWLLCDRRAWNDVGGMWDRSFLYCEEPDLCTRLAAIGARSFVWGDLPVNHQRGGTIKRRLSQDEGLLIHDDARKSFRQRWGGNPELGVPKQR